MIFHQLYAAFEDYERGLPRLHAIRDAIRQADEAGDEDWRFQFRYEYLKESIFCGDRYYAMLIFPELLALYDHSEHLQSDDEFRFQMLVAFKWIVEAAPEFPQITKAEIDSYFRLFKKRLLENGCSLSIYYMKRCLFYLHCDPSIAAMSFYRYLEAPLDAISDGRALYYDQQVIYYLSIGEEERALRAAEPIVEGRMTSNALPQATYHEFLKFYLKNGKLSAAKAYADRMPPVVFQNPYYLDIIATLMIYHGIEASEKGETLFLDHLPLYQQSRNPAMRMHFAIGAAHLFRLFRRQGKLHIRTKISLPQEGSGAALTDSVQEISAFFEQDARNAAARFDTRNGTDDFMQLVQFDYTKFNES